MSNKQLLILSDNIDFIEPLSDLVTRELGITCKAVAPGTDLDSLNACVLVSDRPLTAHFPFPVITVNIPVKIRSLLDNIDMVAANPVVADIINIMPEFKLSQQHKTLSHKSGATATLTDKENGILLAIANSGEAGVSKEVLLKEVWKIDASLDTHTLETHIYRLRKKIKDAFGVEMIKASEGGYRL